MATRTSIFATNDVLNADDLNSLAGAWNSYTPTLSQSSTVTATVTYAKYLQFGKLVMGNVLLAVTGTGSAGTKIAMTLPVAAVGSLAHPIGTASIYDVSTTTQYHAMALWASSTVVDFVSDATANNRWGAVPNVGLQSGDSISLTFTYEAA